jgi:phosphoribosylamine--glycine ligase
MTKKTKQELLTSPIRVAVLGSGAREHALAAKLATSPLCRELTVLPGNDGMKQAGLKIRPVDLKDHAAVLAELEALEVDLTVIGPDDVLAAGLVDELEAAGMAVFGPRRAAARIEWSKAFAKQVMEAAGIPTAKYKVLEKGDLAQLPEVISNVGGYPVVLKYDGLALGKGVRICVDETEALAFAKEVLESDVFARAEAKAAKARGGAAPKLVVEQFLSGHEVSIFALTDGTRHLTLEPACDHKRLGEGNTGPNTGGMGAYSPVPWLPSETVREMADHIFPPLLAKLREEKSAFRGLIYAGLMVNGRQYWVLEFNARFGDPETQALLPRLESDLLPLMWGVATQTFERNLDASPPRWSPRSCVNVVAASRGYPEKPETGFAISGLERVATGEECRVYFAGVKSAGAGGLVNSGGRVLGVSALGDSLEHARARALVALEQVNFEGMRFRRDIGGVRSHY